MNMPYTILASGANLVETSCIDFNRNAYFSIYTAAHFFLPFFLCSSSIPLHLSSFHSSSPLVPTTLQAADAGKPGGCTN